MNTSDLFQHLLGNDFEKILQDRKEREKENLSFDVEEVKKRAYQKYGKDVDQYFE